MALLSALSFAANSIYFFFQRKTVKRFQREREEETDSPVENKKCLAEGSLNLNRASSDGSGVGNTPVRGHGLARPQRTGLLGRIVANCKNEVHRWGAGTRKFIPTLASQTLNRYMSRLELLQSFGPNRGRWMTSGTVGGEPIADFVVQNGFGHDGTRRVSRA
jgi:hypothetical protein